VARSGANGITEPAPPVARAKGIARGRYNAASNAVPENIQLTLFVKPSDADPEEVDLLTRRLRSELQDLPIDSVSLVSGGEVPAGAKAGDPVTLGALTLSLAPIVVPPLLEFLKGWISRKEGRRLVIRKKVGDASTEIEINAPLSESALSALVDQLSPQR